MQDFSFKLQIVNAIAINDIFFLYTIYTKYLSLLRSFIFLFESYLIVISHLGTHFAFFIYLAVILHLCLYSMTNK